MGFIVGLKEQENFFICHPFHPLSYSEVFSLKWVNFSRAEASSYLRWYERSCQFLETVRSGGKVLFPHGFHFSQILPLKSPFPFSILTLLLKKLVALKWVVTKLHFSTNKLLSFLDTEK